MTSLLKKLGIKDDGVKKGGLCKKEGVEYTETAEWDSDSRKSRSHSFSSDSSSLRRMSGTSIRRCSFCKDDQEMEHTDFCARCDTVRDDGVCHHEKRSSIRRCSNCNLSFHDLDNGQERMLI